MEVICLTINIDSSKKWYRFHARHVVLMMISSEASRTGVGAVSQIKDVSVM
jgi:hypothetical protein